MAKLGRHFKAISQPGDTGDGDCLIFKYFPKFKDAMQPIYTFTIVAVDLQVSTINVPDEFS